MRIAVVGATGMIGSRVVVEAADRGHEVTAISRRGDGVGSAPAVHPVAADAADLAAMVELFTRAHVAVAATRPARGDERSAHTVTATLLDAAAAAGRRLVVVGGAGPLRVPGEPDRLVIDAPAYVPPAWRTIALASLAQLEACRAHEAADWTYVSPPAHIEPGERTGTYRRGTTTLLLAPDRTSSISVKDFAVAVIDELEDPCGERHFTVARSLDQRGRRNPAAVPDAP